MKLFGKDMEQEWDDLPDEVFRAEDTGDLPDLDLSQLTIDMPQAEEDNDQSSSFERGLQELTDEFKEEKPEDPEEFAQELRAMIHQNEEPKKDLDDTDSFIREIQELVGETKREQEKTPNPEAGEVLAKKQPAEHDVESFLAEPEIPAEPETPTEPETPGKPEITKEPDVSAEPEIPTATEEPLEAKPEPEASEKQETKPAQADPLIRTKNPIDDDELLRELYALMGDTPKVPDPAAPGTEHIVSRPRSGETGLTVEEPVEDEEEAVTPGWLKGLFLLLISLMISGMTLYAVATDILARYL